MQPSPQLPRVLGTPILPGLPPFLAFTQGDIWHVRPTNGLDTNTGKSSRQAFKTLAAALAAATEDQNDVVLFYAESADKDYTTDVLAAMLDWNKNLVHLIGVNSGVNISPRSRIEFAPAYNSAAPLFRLTASGCYIANILFSLELAGTSSLGAVDVQGNRNRFENCHIAGIGHPNNDVSGAYSLRLAGEENEFVRCTIGRDTIARGTGDNCEILLAGGARCKFIDCDIVTYAEANTHQFLKKAASSTDRFTLFRNCAFINAIQSAAVAMLEALDVTAGGSPGGMIVLKNCLLIGAAEWEASVSVSGSVYADMPGPDAAGGGVALAVTGA